MNKSTKSGETYHHGSLRDALVTAADAILLERGSEGFTLREAARRAGVSPAAPSHHFGSVAGLLTEVATRAFEDLTRSLRAAKTDTSPADRLRAQIVAYVHFALDHPGRFHLMFRKERLDPADQRLKSAGQEAYGELVDSVRRYLDKGTSQPDIAACAAGYWSLAHGFAQLAMDGKFQAAKTGDADLLEELLSNVVVMFVP